MTYQSENLTIRSQDDIDEELDALIMRVKERVVDALMEEQVPAEVALSIFATFYSRTACEMMELPIHVAKEAINVTLDLHYADKEKDGVEWLN